MFNTVSARELQTSYTKVLSKAKMTNEPFIVMRNNKPAGAVISMDLLKKLTTILIKSGDLELIDEETEKRIGKAMEDLKAGRYTIASTPEEIEKHLKSL
ncbi:hypothetical protein CO051_05910 [Candidatus Roizmanbacteria bacterium CG_4_9_14_0_2_um_filter_39_13]|uniref:Antitoxin n=1 Tax=Candidatus Roizmanbacteria bacterium CG_4_9_14_0_2_um_filter_39_13 TaxID=1974839 RepID=A0A2M8EX24_9BACT|nr:MAG: hypothetical protein COY15_04585 [Candidatus Roizmanbacteria bacterium CG_4_10_14_0_2_um_filter_39_12]PJC30399.1 MAG: hypothetical protein CO051_05910 [Candidatus Roizmanbacteria bacterium CG_4_9_14_0_2_um_filter_39_13]